MKEKTVVLPTENALSVDLIYHDVSACPLTKFAEKLVLPYYSGNISEAVKDFIRNAIREEDFVLSHVKPVKSGDYG